MLYANLLHLGIFAIIANAQSSSSGDDQKPISTEASIPTGSYLSYSTTSTRASTTVSIPYSTSAIVSTITSGSTTETTTLGSTTLFSYSSGIIAANSTGTTTQKNSRTVLQGTARTTSALNGTATGNSTSTAEPQPTNTTPCNNYPEFCNRKYGNITEIAAHNSPFVRTGNAAANQALPVITQLNDGIRLLQAQMHFVNSTPHFCHTSCDILDAGPITDYLGDVYDWVTNHPYDVVTILLGNGALDNGSYASVQSYAEYIEKTGLVDFAYIPPIIPMNLTDWPTLGSMILQGKRVIFLMDYNADQAAVPWILDEFSQMWETPFDPTDRSLPCTVQRPPNQTPEDTASKLYMANHNLNYEINLLGNSLLVPYTPLLNVTNNVTGDGSLGNGAQNCTEKWDRPPKFLNVDYYNIGNGSVFEVAAQINNVTYNRKCCGYVTGSSAATLEIVGRSAILAAFAVVAFSWLMM